MKTNIEKKKFDRLNSMPTVITKLRERISKDLAGVLKYPEVRDMEELNDLIDALNNLEEKVITFVEATKSL
jgi:hypothetical protein